MFRKKERAPAPNAAPPPPPPVTGGSGGGGSSSADPARAMRREQERVVRGAQRDYDRELAKLRQDEAKAKAEIRRLAAAGRTADAAQVAKMISQNRKFQEQIMRGKGQAASLNYQMGINSATQKMAGVMQDTTQLMAQSNAAMNPEAMMRTAQQYELESGKMEMAQEMTGDALESAFGGQEVDAEADHILGEVLAQAGLEVRSQLGATPQVRPVQAQSQGHQLPDAEQRAREEEEFQRRLAALGP